MKILKDITTEVQIGYQDRYGLEYSSAGSHYLILAQDIDPISGIKLNENTRVNPSNPDRYLLQKGDVLFLARGGEHKSVCVEFNLPNVLATNAYYIFRTTEEILPQYLAWYLNQKPAQDFIAKHSRQTAVSYIQKEAILKLKVPVPGLERQRSIVELWEQWKKEVHLHHALLSAKTKYMQSIFSRLAQESNV